MTLKFKICKLGAKYLYKHFFYQNVLVTVYLWAEPVNTTWNEAVIPHLITGTFEDKVALLDEVKCEFEVQIGALAQGLEVGAELAEGGVIHFAVEGDVVLDLRAAVDPMQDVALQVLVYGVILLQAVQRDVVEWQRAGDVLKTESFQSGTFNTLHIYKIGKNDHADRKKKCQMLCITSLYL